MFSVHLFIYSFISQHYLQFVCANVLIGFLQSIRLHVFCLPVCLFEGSFLSEITHLSGTSESL